MDSIISFINMFPSWSLPALFAAVTGLAALFFFIVGKAQGYTSEDYRAVRRRNRARRRRRY